MLRNENVLLQFTLNVISFLNFYYAYYSVIQQSNRILHNNIRQQIRQGEQDR
uniref:Uncharacterized protein n=1 Tax=Anguilla anguilla TaxID=7936 RepID=A0A0E9QCQ0_ANGAN